jgi:hypothetical protein
MMKDLGRISKLYAALFGFRMLISGHWIPARSTGKALRAAHQRVRSYRRDPHPYLVLY